MPDVDALDLPALIEAHRAAQDAVRTTRAALDTAHAEAAHVRAACHDRLRRLGIVDADVVALLGAEAPA